MRPFASLITLIVLATHSGSASADVLEIDSQGARWISVGHSFTPKLYTPAEVSIAADNAAIAVDDASVSSRIPAFVPQAYAKRLTQVALRYQLSPALLEALVWQESRWRVDAHSRAGARGLTQLMPGTAKYLGVDAGDPLANLEGGARYLRLQLDRFKGDLEKALAAYNAGPSRVQRANGVPAIRETQAYVASVIGRLTDDIRSD